MLRYQHSKDYGKKIFLKNLQEAFNVITRYELPVSKEDLEQVDNLRYTWQQLQATALASHVQLLKMQPQFEEDLKNNLDKFRDDNVEYCHEYRHAGPMQSGLSPREASDKLILFQVGSKYHCVHIIFLDQYDLSIKYLERRTYGNN